MVKISEKETKCVDFGKDKKKLLFRNQTLCWEYVPL